MDSRVCPLTPLGRFGAASLRGTGLFFCLVFGLGALPAGTGDDSHEVVRGITISCQSYGPEWGSPGFATELDELRTLGANWVAIHPYARIRGDGSVVDRGGDGALPEWLSSPVRTARERGLKILIKPHLSYWGSKFSWRGEIGFPDPVERARFFETYSKWIVGLARRIGPVDAFAVGTELDLMLEFEEPWRELIADVREVSDAKLVYAANWPDYERVPFWDALDAIGVQAYFPLVDEGQHTVDEAQLLAGWARVLPGLRKLHERIGKPVIFTELGYNLSLDAASRPWDYPRAAAEDVDAARALQTRCLKVALQVLERERDWLRGAFLWKWFVGAAPRANFLLDTPEVRAVLASEWADD
ncbi:MAG: hypothetical protein ACI8QZ_001515 [Chlamydiales bacterium]|jgi:hypothetical protein